VKDPIHRPPSAAAAGEEPAAAAAARPALAAAHLAPAAGEAGAARPPERRQVERRRPLRAASWSSKDVLRAAALVFALYFGLQLLWALHPLILTGFVGVLFGLGVSRGADYLERVRVPRGIAAGLIVLATYGALGGVMAIAAPTLQKQFGELRRRLPEAMDRVDQWIAANRGNVWGQILEGSAETSAASPAAAPASLPPTTPASAAGQGLVRRSERALGRVAAGRSAGGAAAGVAGKGVAGTAMAGASGAGAAPGTAAGAAGTAAGAPGAAPVPLRVRLAHLLGAATRYLFPFLSSTVEVLAGLLLITFVAIYFSVDPELYRRGLLHLVPHPSRERTDELITAVGITLRRWLATQLVAMVLIGTLVWIALASLGVEAALSLGIIAGVFEFIPTIGPLLAALPAVAMGFLASPEKALAVAIVFTLVEMVEGHLLIPMLMKKGMNLPPLVTILGQAMMAVVFGFLGLLVAVPVVATLLIAVKMLYVNDVMGDEVVLTGPDPT
jgi:predicted PurR-regulated permease PerM